MSEVALFSEPLNMVKIFFPWRRRLTGRLTMHALLGVVLFCAMGWASALAADLQVGDAYVRGSEDGQTWAIGTKTIRMVFEGRGEKFRWTSLQNRIGRPAPRVYRHENRGKLRLRSPPRKDRTNGDWNLLPQNGYPLAVGLPRSWI